MMRLEERLVEPVEEIEGGGFLVLSWSVVAVFTVSPHGFLYHNIHIVCRSLIHNLI